MKKVLLIILTLFVGFAGKVSGQAILRIDSAASFGIKFDILAPKHQVVVYYKVINIAKNDSDSVTRGLKFYTNLRINTEKAVSTSKGRIILDNLKPYFLSTKNYIIVYDTIVLADSVKIPPFGTNVIVIWPTGNGVHSMFLNNPHAFQVTYTDIAPVSAPENLVKIYPNPATDIIHFEILNREIKLQRVIIRDMTGKEIMNQAFMENELNISALPKGCYILDMNFSDGSSGIYKLIRTE